MFTALAIIFGLVCLAFASLVARHFWLDHKFMNRSKGLTE